MSQNFGCCFSPKCHLIPCTLTLPQNESGKRSLAKKRRNKWQKRQKKWPKSDRKSPENEKSDRTPFVDLLLQHTDTRVACELYNPSVLEGLPFKCSYTTMHEGAWSVPRASDGVFLTVGVSNGVSGSVSLGSGVSREWTQHSGARGPKGPETCPPAHSVRGQTLRGHCGPKAPKRLLHRSRSCTRVDKTPLLRGTKSENGKGQDLGVKCLVTSSKNRERGNRALVTLF